MYSWTFFRKSLFCNRSEKHSHSPKSNWPQPKRAVSMRSARGSRSLRIFVRAVSKLGKPCTQLKNHFEYESSYRTVIGYAECLALADPERFIWISRWKQMQNVKGKKKRQLYNCLAFFEQHDLLTSARRFRNKAWRDGWIVADHAQFSDVVDQLCCLKLTNSPSPAPRTKGQRRFLSAFEAARVHLKKPRLHF